MASRSTIYTLATRGAYWGGPGNFLGLFRNRSAVDDFLGELALGDWDGAVTDSGGALREADVEMFPVGSRVLDPFAGQSDFIDHSEEFLGMVSDAMAHGSFGRRGRACHRRRRSLDRLEVHPFGEAIERAEVEVFSVAWLAGCGCGQGEHFGRDGFVGPCSGDAVGLDLFVAEVARQDGFGTHGAGFSFVGIFCGPVLASPH